SRSSSKRSSADILDAESLRGFPKGYADLRLLLHASHGGLLCRFVDSRLSTRARNRLGCCLGWRVDSGLAMGGWNFLGRRRHCRRYDIVGVPDIQKFGMTLSQDDFVGA